MHVNETTSTTSKKHHRIHPITEHNAPTNDNSKPHTILNLPSNDDDITSLQNLNQHTNSQTSNSSSSIDPLSSYQMLVAAASLAANQQQNFQFNKKDNYCEQCDKTFNSINTEIFHIFSYNYCTFIVNCAFYIASYSYYCPE